MHPDLILTHGRFTTNDRANPDPEAVAITGGCFSAVGSLRDILATRGPATRVLSLDGRRAIPGLIDSHIHVIRGGLNYNMELRWDGVRSLADAMAMLKRQVAITPPPQWVRVVGGFTAHQFVEKRLPTIEELNAVAPDTPVFLLHLYDRALLNGAALRAVGYTKDTPDPPAGEIVRDAHGNPTGRWTWWKEDGKVAQSADLSQSEGVVVDMPRIPAPTPPAARLSQPPQRQPIKR